MSAKEKNRVERLVHLARLANHEYIEVNPASDFIRGYALGRRSAYMLAAYITKGISSAKYRNKRSA